MTLDPQSKVCEVGAFQFYAHNGSIVIMGKDGDIEISPSESTTLCTSLNTVGSIAHFKSIPPFIKDRPFEINFNESGSCILTRNNEDNGLNFMMTEVDDLIKGIKMALDKIKDTNMITGGPSPGTPGYNLPDPILEGR